MLPPSTVRIAAVVLARRRQIDERVGHVLGRDFAAQQIAAHIVRLADSPRAFERCAIMCVGQKAGADAVGIDRIGADAVAAMIERVLLHQEQRRGLGQTVGPEILAGIDRLLRDVEQEAAAGALRLHHAHGVLRHRLMGEEIELEGVAQGRVVHRADRALPCGAGIGDHDIDAAETLRRLRRRRRAHLRRFGHVAGDGERRLADSRATGAAAVAVAVEHGHFGARARERFGGRRADAASRRP